MRRISDYQSSNPPQPPYRSMLHKLYHTSYGISRKFLGGIFMIINTMKAIGKVRRMKINPRYDIHLGNINDIMQNSLCMQDAISNAFRFGFLQGMKAEMKNEASRI